MRRTLDTLVQCHAGQCPVRVVHGGVVAAAFHHFLGSRPGPFEGGHPAAGHGAITLWQRPGRRDDWVLMVANDRQHLAALAAAPLRRQPAA